MPYLILPSKRTRQPAGAVRVLPAYQASLLSLVLPRQVWGPPITSVTSDAGQTTAAGPGGVGYNPRGGSNGPRFTNTSAAPDKSVGYPLTLIAFARLQNSPGSGFHTIISLANAADYFVRVILTDASGVAQLQCNGSGGTGSAASAASAWARNADNSFAGVVRTAADRSVYVGGKKLASNTTNIGAATNLNRLAYGAYDGAAVNYIADGLIYTAGVWLRAFPDEEVAEFGRYPYLALAPDLCRIYFDAGAGGGTTLSPVEGHLLATGYAPSISAPIILSPGTGTLLFTGYAPTISQSSGVTLTPATGNLLFAGYASSISQNQTLSPGTGNAFFTGYVPSISQNVTLTLSPTEGHLSLLGSTPSIAQAISVTPTEGHTFLGGYAPVIEQVAGNQIIVPASGSIFLTGYVPGVSQDAIPQSFSSPPYGGGGGGKRAWKELDGDRKIDEIVEDWKKRKDKPEKEELEEEAPAPRAKTTPAKAAPAKRSAVTNEELLARIELSEERILTRFAEFTEIQQQQLRRVREEIDAVVEFFGGEA